MAVAYLSSDTLTGIRTPLCWTPLSLLSDSSGSHPRLCQHVGVNEAFSLMWRDLTDAPFLAVLLVLPALLSVRSVLQGSLLGWIAPVILMGQLVAWFYYYYASDVPNVGWEWGWRSPWFHGRSAWPHPWRRSSPRDGTRQRRRNPSGALPDARCPGARTGR